MEGFPLRSWSIELYLLNEHGEEVPATLFDKVIYRLHPSFGERANQSMSPNSRLTARNVSRLIHCLISYQNTPFPHPGRRMGWIWHANWSIRRQGAHHQPRPELSAVAIRVEAHNRTLNKTRRRDCSRKDSCFLTIADFQTPEASSAWQTTRIRSSAWWWEWRQVETRSHWWRERKEKEKDREECGCPMPNWLRLF